MLLKKMTAVQIKVQKRIDNLCKSSGTSLVPSDIGILYPRMHLCVPSCTCTPPLLPSRFLSLSDRILPEALVLHLVLFRPERRVAGLETQEENA
mmetsp:Transcript_23944/g.40681  ORF Transcript_23944/g.40681 Transcript_23944/m.40681 type:complete len:94 (-) Transcript_23944:177-458(-)